MATWQRAAARFARKHNLTHDPGVYVLDLASEVGEIAKAHLEATDYGARPLTLDERGRALLEEEVGDALYSLCMLAETTGIELDAAFAAALEKYERRRLKQSHPGSR